MTQDTTAALASTLEGFSSFVEQIGDGLKAASQGPARACHGLSVCVVCVPARGGLYMHMHICIAKTLTRVATKTPPGANTTMGIIHDWHVWMRTHTHAHTEA